MCLHCYTCINFVYLVCTGYMSVYSASYIVRRLHTKTPLTGRTYGVAPIAAWYTLLGIENG